MGPEDKRLVRVHSSWDGWQSAEVRLAGIRKVYWFQPEHAPHEMVHAIVSCADIVSGELPHACDGAPDDLRVCLLKRHVLQSVYGELAASAGVRTAIAAADPAARVYLGVALDSTRMAPAKNSVSAK